jgi:hypothetical protein
MVSATGVSVLVGERDMDNEQRLTSVCVSYVKLLDFNSSATASPVQQVCSRLEGALLSRSVLITFSFKLQFYSTG